MPKFLLTSTGLANKNIASLFLEIINKPVSQIKIVFIPTAARSEEELKYVVESKKELLALGISEKNITTLELDRPVSFQEIESFDVIYVCGGNTFHLLKKVRETNFDQVISEFVRNNKLYFGVSAGSILVCPNIEIAKPFDENDVNLTNLTGLNLIDFIVSPHFCEKEEAIINNFKKESRFEIITLTDRQALLLVDGKMKLIE
jgi:dipeptidase E